MTDEPEIDVRRLYQMWASLDPRYRQSWRWVMSEEFHDALVAGENKRRKEQSSAWFTYTPIDLETVSAALAKGMQSQLLGLPIRIADVDALMLEWRD